MDATKEQLDAEDYDLSNSEDQTMPFSTKSKIVVVLDKEENKYIIDSYDEMRMKLLFSKRKLFSYYHFTIESIETNIDKQPWRKEMPCHYKILFIFIEVLLLLLIFYAFLLIAQICLLNPLIIGILAVWYR